MAGKASIENGRKGGRPKGSIAKSTQDALLQRDYVVRRFEENLEPIVDKAIEQAISGDKTARDWLSDQSWGKPKQAVEMTGRDGEPLFTEIPVPITELAKKLNGRGQ